MRERIIRAEITFLVLQEDDAGDCVGIAPMQTIAVHESAFDQTLKALASEVRSVTTGGNGVPAEATGEAK